MTGSSPTVVAAEVLAPLGDQLRSLLDCYVDLHRHPELSLREVRTAGIVAEALSRSGYEVTTGVGGTGVVGVMTNGDGPSVALRADMDALPVREETGLAYASEWSPTMATAGRSASCTPAGMTLMSPACSVRRTCWRGPVTVGAAC